MTDNRTPSREALAPYGRSHRIQPRGECPSCGKKGLGQWHDSGMGSTAIRLRECRYCTHQVRAERQTTSGAGVEVAADLAAIGPRPAGKVLAWAEPRPCFYRNTDIRECGQCHGCRERLARANYEAPTPPEESSQVAGEAVVRKAVRDFWVCDVNKPSWFRDDQNERLIQRILAALSKPQPTEGAEQFAENAKCSGMEGARDRVLSIVSSHLQQGWTYAEAVTDEILATLSAQSPAPADSTAGDEARREGREGCVGRMTTERAIYFLERFKREEKLLGPHEQWALDYTVSALKSRDDLAARSSGFQNAMNSECARANAAEAKLEQAKGALEAVEPLLSQLAMPSQIDLAVADGVHRLGEKHGYGALMTCASAIWRDRLGEQGHPMGGEFVVGPCRTTAENAWKAVRQALASLGNPSEGVK